MQIIAYKPQYKENVRGICLETASKRAREDPTHRAFTLTMYCDEYLDKEQALLLEDEEEIKGYILCARSFDQWIKRAQPYHEAIRALGNEYRERLDRETEAYSRFAHEYPAHIHIDLSHDVTGGGWGGKLLEQMMQNLTEHKVKGAMLGVSASNVGAIRFYQKHDFDILEHGELSLTMGRKLI